VHLICLNRVEEKEREEVRVNGKERSDVDA
jgi:hypothetical protein